MLFAILSDGASDRPKRETTCTDMDPHVGPFSLECVVEHKPTDASAYSWTFGGIQYIAVTIESAREDYGVVVPSGVIAEAKRYGKAP